MRFLAFILALVLSASALGQIDSTQIEALSRLKEVDLETNPALKNAVLKVLEKTKGTPQFVEIVRDFKIKGQTKELVDFASKYPTDSTGVEALRLAFAESGPSALQPISLGLIQAMGNSAEKQFVLLLTPILDDTKQPAENRKAAVKALAQTEDGAAHILNPPPKDNLDPSPKSTATAALHSARWPNVKTEAAKLLPLPQTQNSALAPVSELVKLTGNPANGAKVLRLWEREKFGGFS